MPKHDWIKKVLILGSGAIKIGEAGEFDYSGAQAIKALKEEGIETVLVNPNIATIQTDKRFADKVYLLPVTAEFVEKVIKHEKPDGIFLGFGGQTALNCGIDLHDQGILEKYNVRILGTPITGIKLADDRDLFRETLLHRNISIPDSKIANSVEQALEIAKDMGYPIVVRVAYTLGGLGSGIAKDEEELKEIASRGLVHSGIEQILIEEFLDGWKEVEYEIMRDRHDNCLIVCNMENMDPMGVHTGESIVVAPSQILSNKEYHLLRRMSFKVIRALGVVGECNIQFAVNPKTSKFKVIEVNSRLSRSSALASKATAYPIAYIAAKLSIGYTLDELKNKVTGMTSACFEPSLDYIVVKIPRWDLQKFKGAPRVLGTQMKSVGEVMAIGRCFEESLQKAVRMLGINRELTDYYKCKNNDIENMLSVPTDERVFYLTKAMKDGMSIDKIADLTKIDKWFLYKLKNIVDLEDDISSNLSEDVLREAKRYGFSDAKIGSLVEREEGKIRDMRKRLGIVPVVKQIDTLAAEWPATTNYLYLTYGGTENDIEFVPKKKAIVLGSGCYRIGSSVEFDWCCVNMAQFLQKGMEEVIMINYNPETVSTDFDIPDKLYFEELSLERVLDICDNENPTGVVVSVGGQIPNNLAVKLSENNVKLLGTAPENINRAENRSLFSAMLDELGISQPYWSKLDTKEEAKKFTDKVGYPVLVRPSYVLSGSAMNVAYSEGDLESFLDEAVEVSQEYPVVISKFILGGREIEVDGVCDGENVMIGSIMEHIENAGVHSGDATIIIPTFSISDDIKDRIRDYTRKISRALKIRGPFNIQYIVKNDNIYVIECNLRSSRSMPFVSKTVGTNLMDVAANVFLGNKIEDSECVSKIHSAKVPQFSFVRILGSDPVTGVEMVSTGEVACFGTSFKEALLKGMVAGGFRIPKKGDKIFISMGGAKDRLIPTAKKLAEKFKIYATEHTAATLRTEGIPCDMLYKISEEKKPNVLDYLMSKRIKFVINIPKINGDMKKTFDDEFLIRRKAVEFGIPVITNLELAETFGTMITGDTSFKEISDFN